MTTTTQALGSARPLGRTPNRYLEGNFAPVEREVTATELAVTGRIPDFLDGRYLRNGPNPIAPDPARYEWFTGAGMVHGLRLRDGRAHWYRNRWVRSNDVARTLGGTWPGGPAGGGFDFAANTNVVGLGARTLAIAEAGVTPYELSDDLETLGTFDFCGTLRGAYTAHPKTDPVTGELHAVSYSPFNGNRVQYTVAGVDGLIKRCVDIPVAVSPMMHDFSLTENFVVVYDLPVTLDLRQMFAGRSLRAVAARVNRVARRHQMPGPMQAAMRHGSRKVPVMAPLPYRWDPKHRARIGVLPRDGVAADIRWFDIAPCFVYHPMNAYEDGRKIVLDVVRYEKVFAGADGPLHEQPPTLDRWTVDLAAGTVSDERLDDDAQEFPRVDERLVGRRHRFGYSVRYTRDTDDGFPVPNAVLRRDAETGSTRAIEFGAGREPGEFVFAPSAPDAAEDEGVLMGFVYDTAEDRSDLVLLDAASLDEIGSVALPGRVPNGFHGNWIPG